MMTVNSNERNRAFIVFVVFCVWVLFIGVSLVKTQVFDYGKNVGRVRSQSNYTFPLQSKRGTIYDRSGEVLAISVKANSAFLSNRDKADSLRLLNRVLRSGVKLTRKEISKIKDRIKQGDKFIWVKRKLSAAEHQRLEKIKTEVKADDKIESILDFVEEFKRVYPHKATACHILGGVGVDEQGLGGIEYGLDDVLRGKDSNVKVVRDARRRVFKLKYLSQPVDGQDIYLTIDAPIQFFVEKELEKTVKKYGAKSGTVIVMDSRDGAVLAMAGYPGFDPGMLKYTPQRLVKNNAISFLYHPGSTFKIVLASTVLEKNLCSPQQIFQCHNGVYQVKDREITDDHAYERLTLEEVIIHSSNIGAVKIGELLGAPGLYKGIKRFGFGGKIGLELPGEERGILNPLDRWSGVSQAFMSYGYEIAVTPLQMTRAFNVIASGGFLVRPYVVKAVGETFTPGQRRNRVLSPATVLRMRTIMQQVVSIGTGQKARIEGIPVAGKTGTTKKIQRRRKKVKKFVSSFGGFFPARQPRVTMFVVLDEPEGLYYGGDVAAPLFKSIAQRLAIYLKVFPELDKKHEIRL